MKEAEALTILSALAAEHGILEACARVAAAAKIKSTTVYGWWRRGQIPEWRLLVFTSLAEQSSKPSKRRNAK